MPRFSLYEGVPGFLCPHPAAEESNRRHPGMKRRPIAEGETWDGDYVGLFEPVPQVFAEHRCLTKAVAAKQLKALKGPVVAKNLTEAIAQLKPAKATPKLKLSKGDD